MKILMSGGTGLIGRAFIERFPEHQFTLLCRPLQPASSFFLASLRSGARRRARQQLPESVAVIENLTQLENLDDFDAVINLAGEPIIDRRWTASQKNIICQSRWRLTEQLVALLASSRRPPRVLLSGSAIGVYGDQGAECLNEAASIAAADFPSQLCQRWEAIAQQAAAHTRVVCLRTGIVLATGGGALAKMRLPFKCGLGGRLGDGRQFMSWIHLDDHLRAMAYLLEADDINGPVNLVAPAPVSNRTFTRALGAAVKRPALLPAPAMLLSLLLGESACLLLGSQRVLPEKLLAAGFEFEFSEVGQALEDLLG